MYKNLTKLFTLCLSFCVTFGYADAVPRQDSPSGNTQTLTNEEEIKEAEEFYPFKKSQSEIDSDLVTGIKISDKKVTLLSSENTFSSSKTEAEAALEDMEVFERYKNLTCININASKLTSAMLGNLRKHIPSKIQALIIDSQEVEDISELAGIISGLANLQSLDIRLFKLSPEETAELLKSMTLHEKVKFLSFGFDNLNAGSVQEISRILSSEKDTLENLALAWTQSGAEAEDYQTLVTSLQELKLAKLELAIGKMPSEQTKVVLASLGDINTLTNFKLFLGNIGKNEDDDFEAAKVLRESLKKLSSLQEIDISGSGWSGNSLKLIFQSIADMKQLKTLDISGNIINSETAEELSNSMRETNALQKLIANDCKINADTFKVLCGGLSNTELKYVSFQNNTIKNAAQNLPIASMSHLVAADFSQNDMNHDDAMAVIEQTKDHPTLRIVNFKGNSGIDELSGAYRTDRNDEFVKWKLKNCPNNQSVSFFGL